ncbi:MAG TPA: hypothetical protein DD624_03520 [Alphaproteobacteria bacterium]|nr:hypothetical protein [Alphaproteobacteria bacterium]
MFRFVFFAWLIVFSNAALADIIPFTQGNLKEYKSLDSGDKLKFLLDFYKKNKAVGATDGEIINEIVKIDEIQNDSAFQTLARLSSKIKSMESYVRHLIEGVNRDIEKQNPGRPDLLIDYDDSSTWKNFQYVAIGDRTIRDYFSDFSKEKFFSDAVYTESGAVMLASCARTQNKREMLMGVMVLLDKSAVILQQKEGESKTPVTVDFSGSENVDIGDLSYPLQRSLPEFGGVGYATEAVLPFTVKIKNDKTPPVVRAVVSANVCRNGKCAAKTFPSVEYTIEPAYLESSVCTELTRTRYNAPANHAAGIEVAKAFFATANGTTDLTVRIKKPFSFSDTPRLMVTNTEGLLFDEPFTGSEGGHVFYRVQLKNPEKLSGRKKIPVTMTFFNDVKSDEITMDVTVGGFDIGGFSTSFSGCVSALISGFKFLFLTPLLTALLMLAYLILNDENRSVEKTDAFFDGLADSLKILLPFYAVLTIAGTALPRSFYWGVQFASPLVNGMFVLLFIAAAFIVPKLFDESFVKRIKGLNRLNVNEKAGLLAGLLCGGLLTVTPFVSLFYEWYGLISQSPLVYVPLFLLPIAGMFVVLVLFDGLSADTDGKTCRPLKGFMLLPLAVQAVLLTVLAGLQSGLFRMLIFIVFAAAAWAIFFRYGKKRLAFFAAAVGILALPIKPNGYDFNKLGALPFDEKEISQSVAEGKSVYLNVTESGCLMCQINRLMVMYRGGAKAIQDGRLIIMRVPYTHPFVRQIMQGTGKDVLPANLLFSPKTPAGKILPSVIGPWTTPDIVREYVQPLSKSTN